MRPSLLALPLAFAAACSSTEPEQPDAWSSDAVTLRLVDGAETIHLLASGGCYGSYGEIPHPIPSGTFTLSGTWTQLMGAYPGSVTYPAEYAGTVSGRRMTISINVPAAQQTLGPFELTPGIVSDWPACRYP